MKYDPETIRKQQESQESLQDNIEKLEENVVDAVKSTANEAAETVESVKELVHDTVESVEETARSVREAFDISRQVDRHPWALFGGAIAAGFVATWLTTRSRRPEPAFGAFELPPPPSPAKAPTMQVKKAAAATHLPNGKGKHPHTHRNGNGHSHGAKKPVVAESTPAPAPAPVTDWVNQLTENYAPELNKLKSIAISSVLGLVRDVVAGVVPPGVKPKVAEFVDDITTKLGAQPLPQGTLKPTPTPTKDPQPKPENFRRSQWEDLH